MRNLATGDLIKLGTLYLGGTKRTRPINPVSGGDVHGFSAGQTIEIRNSEAAEEDKLHWREINDGGKKYLVADRALIRSVSWDDLNAQSLIFGKEITIDGQQYKLRSLTGGDERREGGTGSGYAGGKLPNEWDRWIVNEAGLHGLPTPTATDLDSTKNATDLNGAHNQFWNWYDMYSWCQETYLHNSSSRAFRGYNSARIWLYYNATGRITTIGWRPVLEVLNSSPLITGDSQNQGNKTAPFSVDYMVSDPEGDQVNVVEKLNGSVVNTKNNIAQNVNHTFEITSEQWVSLPLNQESTITIEATDSKGAKSTRTYTFTKTNSAPTVVVVEPKGNLANIAIVDTLTPIFVWSFSDPDAGDVQSAYQVVIENLQDEIIHDSGKKQSAQSFYQLPASVANWGDRLKWKVRVWDKFNVPSEYSFPEFFMPNRPPNVSDVQPGSSDVNNPMGTGLAPEFSWNFEDLDLEAQAAYRLRVFKTDDTLVYDSAKVNRNLQKHQVQEGLLVEGATYYAIVTVWDPNGLSADSEKAYIRTNATPSAPILTGPIDNYRTTQRPTFSGIVGTDPEDDGQHFAIQISQDPNFEEIVLLFRSDESRTGWKVNGYDIPEEGVFNDQQGSTVTYIPQLDLDTTKTYYWRMAAIDAGTKALGKWSPKRKVRVGNVLQFTLSNPISTQNIPARRILFAMDYVLPADGSNKAAIKVEFSNNALDVNPTWEDATTEFKAMDYYNFTNVDKTAAEFAVGVRVTINANDSMQPIYIDAMGLTFD